MPRGEGDRHHLRGRAPREGGGEAEHGQPGNHAPTRSSRAGSDETWKRRQEERVARGLARDLLGDERARRQHGRHDRAPVAGCCSRVPSGTRARDVYTTPCLARLPSSRAAALVLAARRRRARAGPVGVALNRAGSGARAAGMGDAFVAVSDDGTAASWNPAGLAQLRQPEFSFVYAVSDQGLGLSGLRSPDDQSLYAFRYPVSGNELLHRLRERGASFRDRPPSRDPAGELAAALPPRERLRRPVRSLSRRRAGKRAGVHPLRGPARRKHRRPLGGGRGEADEPDGRRAEASISGAVDGTSTPPTSSGRIRLARPPSSTSGAVCT